MVEVDDFINAGGLRGEGRGKYLTDRLMLS